MKAEWWQSKKWGIFSPFFLGNMLDLKEIFPNLLCFSVFYSFTFLLTGTQGKDDEKCAKIRESKYCDTWYTGKRKNVS